MSTASPEPQKQSPSPLAQDGVNYQPVHPEIQNQPAKAQVPEPEIIAPKAKKPPVKHPDPKKKKNLRTH